MGNANVKKIQEALIKKGFNPGVVDGIIGRRTIAAIKAFQKSVGLIADGIVGPLTSAKLFPAMRPPERPGRPGRPGVLLPWMAEAENLLGTKEVTGRGSNPVILDWADDLDIHYPGDDIPWCGLFVAHCIGSTLTREVLPGNPLGAKQWGAFGNPTQPRRGATMVFWRLSRNSGKGHVGFYAGESADAYKVLGGNQSNKVSYAWIGKDRFLKARWPVAGESLVGDSIILINREEELETQAEGEVELEGGVETEEEAFE